MLCLPSLTELPTIGAYSSVAHTARCRTFVTRQSPEIAYFQRSRISHASIKPNHYLPRALSSVTHGTSVHRCVLYHRSHHHVPHFRHSTIARDCVPMVPHESNHCFYIAGDSTLFRSTSQKANYYSIEGTKCIVIVLSRAKHRSQSVS